MRSDSRAMVVLAEIMLQPSDLAASCSPDGEFSVSWSVQARLQAFVVVVIVCTVFSVFVWASWTWPLGHRVLIAAFGGAMCSVFALVAYFMWKQRRVRHVLVVTPQRRISHCLVPELRNRAVARVYHSKYALQDEKRLAIPRPLVGAVIIEYLGGSGEHEFAVLVTHWGRLSSRFAHDLECSCQRAGLPFAKLDASNQQPVPMSRIGPRGLAHVVFRPCAVTWHRLPTPR